MLTQIGHSQILMASLAEEISTSLHTQSSMMLSLSVHNALHCISTAYAVMQSLWLGVCHISILIYQVVPFSMNFNDPNIDFKLTPLFDVYSWKKYKTCP